MLRYTIVNLRQFNNNNKKKIGFENTNINKILNEKFSRAAVCSIDIM